MFVGVRGSGEDAPYGRTVTGVRDALAARWQGWGTVRQVWLDYPAADPHTLSSTPMTSLLLDHPFPSTEYFDSATKGAQALVSLLRREEKRCPDEGVVLVGYSQGAQAITEALGRTNVPSRLAGAVLIGNPDHYPNQNVRELDGSAGLSSLGLASLLQYLRGQVKGDTRDEQVQSLIRTVIGVHEGTVDLSTLGDDMTRAHANIPPDAYQSTYSVCQSGDLVCDADPAMERILTMRSTWQEALDAGRKVHGSYRADRMSHTLEAVSARMNSMAATRSSPSPSPRAVPTPGKGRSPWWQFAVTGGAGLLVGVVMGAGLTRKRRRRRR